MLGLDPRQTLNLKALTLHNLINSWLAAVASLGPQAPKAGRGLYCGVWGFYVLHLFDLNFEGFRLSYLMQLWA